mgnify:CR=1 FL=1
MKSNDFYKGFFFAVLFLGILGVITAVGFHTADEILSGTFRGNFNFNGSVNVTELCIDGNCQTAWPTAEGVPAGAIMSFGMSTCPSGWIEANGSEISRTTYADLFAAYGTMYGSTGGTTFKIPDYRGQFLRGWSHGQTTDPDRASRTNRGEGTTGDNVGTKQSYQIQSHTHTSNVGSDIASNPPGKAAAGTPTMLVENVGSTGGSETRPTNIYVLYCIKY